MNQFLVTISPQGQITIPKQIRNGFNSKKYFLERSGDKLILKPVRIFVNAEKNQNLQNLSAEARIILKSIENGPLSTNDLLTITQVDYKSLVLAITDLELNKLIKKNRAFKWEIIK